MTTTLTTIITVAFYLFCDFVVFHCLDEQNKTMERKKNIDCLLFLLFRFNFNKFPQFQLLFFAHFVVFCRFCILYVISSAFYMLWTASVVITVSTGQYSLLSTTQWLSGLLMSMFNVFFFFVVEAKSSAASLKILRSLPTFIKKFRFFLHNFWRN